MAGLVVSPRARIFHGHEWVYATEVKKVFGNPQPGDVISLKDFKDRPLGSAIYNPNSQIVARRFSRRKQELDADFFSRRLKRAQVTREKLGYAAEPFVYRLVWSESDGLPGVVIDRYGSEFAVQTLTLAMDQRKELIFNVLREEFGAECIVERNDSAIRAAEGLEPVKATVHGTPQPRQLKLDGVSLTLDLSEGQKTGLYLDQLDNYRQVAALAKGRRVLDCFCNQGGFALHAAKAGARAVTAVDSSGPAIEVGRRNAEVNGVTVNFQEHNVFDFLKGAEKEAENAAAYDLIVLDPPSFARNRKSVADAMRGYKEIHLRALRLLEPGGILSTFSCSHHVSRAEFLEVIQEAAVDAKRTLRVIESYTQRADHPVILSIPESEYLCGFSFEVLPAW